VISQQYFERFYPDNKHDGTKAFYDWIREVARPEMVLLNLGAGPATKRKELTFRGEVKRVIGVDIDPIVLENEELDEAHVIKDGKIPLEDGTIDLIFSDYVLEHVEYPEKVMAEMFRVLRPGGSFFFRTPNKYHYVSLIARATPHWVHELIANRVRGLADEAHEPYETYHRLNSEQEIISAAKAAGFSNSELQMFEGQPSYLMFAKLPFLLGVAYERIVNRYKGLGRLRSNIFGRLVK
jgi:SAM-dependent methyltransferase